MILRALAFATFVCCCPTLGHAQPAVSSLTEAEQRLIDSLLHHDRAAFTAMFLPDAESSIPTTTRGPEAIAASWLPFLVDPATTMILTPGGVVVAESGDIAHTTGTFAIKGRTKIGVQTIPVGTYSLIWKRASGDWKISTLGGSFRAKATSTEATSGAIGPYRFGMTRDEVMQVRDCAPYSSVRVTGGLECPHFVFEGREMNISFLFRGPALDRIQLWFYEGTSDLEARAAVSRVLDFLMRTAGGATIASLPGTSVTPDVVIGLMNGGPVQPGRVRQVEISGNRTWFSRVGRSEYGYMVMLFADGANR